MLWIFFGERYVYLNVRTYLMLAFAGVSFLGAACTLLIVDTTGRDPDVIDLQERQEAAGYTVQY